jgi:NAD(P)-dependent dehydrogenase (short-subunit alcohol dehydrogenase family)
MIYFVSGGSRGIGRSIVLGAIAAGHDVAFTYLKETLLAEAVVDEARAIDPSRRCRAYQLDVRDSAAVESIGDAVLDDFDTVHVVVSSAGMNHTNLAISTSDEEWCQVLNTNLTGAFYVCRQFLPALLANGFGRLIFLSSVAQGGMTGQAAYAASKAGILGLSGTLAKEYGPKSITSNVVVVGYFDTDMSRVGVSNANREFWLRHCPVRRIGDLDELVQTVLFLGSEAASFINGQSLAVTGGLDWAP